MKIENFEICTDKDIQERYKKELYIKMDYCYDALIKNISAKDEIKNQNILKKCMEKLYLLEKNLIHKDFIYKINCQILTK